MSDEKRTNLQVIDGISPEQDSESEPEKGTLEYYKKRGTPLTEEEGLALSNRDAILLKMKGLWTPPPPTAEQMAAYEKEQAELAEQERLEKEEAWKRRIEEEEAEDALSTDPNTDPTKIKDLDALRAAISKNSSGTSSRKNSAFSEGEGSDYLDQSDGKVRNFDDLFSRYSIGDGDFFVYVERKTPAFAFGHKISGIQRPIDQTVSFEWFATNYGEGSYLLTVYGPWKRKTVDSQGKLARKAYTKPLKVDVPNPHGQNPPNPDMANLEEFQDQYEEDMRYQGVRRGMTTDSDATIEVARLEHEREMEARRAEREERRREAEEEREREEEERREREEGSQWNVVQSMFKEQSSYTRDLQRQLSQRERGGNNLGEIAQIIQATRPVGPDRNELAEMRRQLEEERRRATEEMARVREDHRREVDRLRDEHRREVSEIRAEYDRNIRDEKDRAEKAMRERVDDLVRQHDRRLQDEQRQHDRELAAAKESNNMQVSTTQQSFDMRLEVKQQEITRLTNELSQVRAEFEAEKNKTLADRVNEFTGAAEALGFSREEGPKGWKDMLGEAALGLVQQAPVLAANVASSLRGQQQMPQLPQRAQISSAQNNFGPVFATDGIDSEIGSYVDGSGPLYPGEDPYADFTSEGIQQPVHQSQVPQKEQPQQAQVEALATVTQQAEKDPSSLNIDDEQILEFSAMFRGAFTSGATPENFCTEVISQIGPVFAGSIVNEVPVERVVKVLQEAPTGDSDPLVRRDGQKFLKQVWEVMQERTAA